MPEAARSSRDDIPRPAALLGIGGLLPFVALSAGLWLLGRDLAGLAADALVAYAAVILSFMGGVHWGVATIYSAPPAATAPTGAPGARSSRLFLASVLPALAAWPAALLEPPLAFAAFAASFLALLAFDISVVRTGLLPGWYGKLRILLTSIVVVCLVVAGLAGLR